MKVVVVTSQKHGSGKTTLAAHVAVEVERASDGPARLIDTDKRARSVCGSLISNNGTRTLMGNSVSPRLARDLCCFVAPASGPPLDGQCWEFINVSSLPLLRWLRKALCDFTYSCWKLTDLKPPGQPFSFDSAQTVLNVPLHHAERKDFV